MMILSGSGLSSLFALPLFVFLTRQIVQLRMTGNYQSFFTGQLIAIILFNCCFYFQGTISPSTLLGEFSSALTSLCQLSPTVFSPDLPSLSLFLFLFSGYLGICRALTPWHHKIPHPTPSYPPGSDKTVC